MRNGFLRRSIFVAALFAAACGPSSYAIRGTSRMPGVDGVIEVGDAPGTNRMVTVQLEHLAPPARIVPGSPYYCVWFRSPHGASTFAGFLEYDEGARRGRLVATTPMRHFVVLVTVERRRDPHEPSQHVVIRQRVG